MLATSTWLMLSGAILVLLGFAIRWKVSAYDLKDAAFDSAWTLARGKRTAENPTALEAKYREIQNQPTWTGKATDGRHRRRPFHRPGAGGRGVNNDAGRAGAGRRRILVALALFAKADWPQGIARANTLHLAAAMILL